MPIPCEELNIKKIYLLVIIYMFYLFHKYAFIMLIINYIKAKMQSKRFLLISMVGKWGQFHVLNFY